MITILVLSAFLLRSRREVKEMLLRKRLIFIRTKAYVIIAFLLFGNAFFAQAQLNPSMGSNPWKYVNPYQYGFVLQDMSFIDNNTGLGVGANGAIAKTTDGGFTWQHIFYKYVSTANQVTMATFNDVHFVTPTIAYAVGAGGLMIKSTDGGTTWTQLVTPLTALSKNINALHFSNKDTGYIGGAAINTSNTTSINDAPKVYFTRNGGATWDSLVTPFRRRQDNATLSGFNTAEIHRIHFVNDSVGYVSGSCGQVSANYSAILWKIEKNVVKDYSIHRSKFGITATTGSYTPATYILKGLVGINDFLVMVSTSVNNVVLRVRTGKNDSTASAVPVFWGAYEPGVYEIVIWLNSTATPFPASLVNIVAGQMPHMKKMPNGTIVITAGKNIVSTPDNGTTWTVAPAPPVPNSWWGLLALDVAPNNRIVTGGTSGILYDSLPGGAWRTQWRTVRPLKASNNGAPFDFNSLDFADCDNGILVGTSGTIAKTSDGGKTWVDNSNPVFEAAQMGIANVVYQNVNNMFFTTPTSVYRSADQGTTNDVIFTEPSLSTFGFGFNQFAMPSADRAFIAAYRGNPAIQRTMIFRTLNANAASPVWDTVKTFPNGGLAPQPRNIKFANIDTGYVTANRGKVYRTVDGGNTWTDVSPDTTAAGNSTANYTALSVVNGKTVFIAGNNRKLFKSTDAGVSWTDLTLAITSPVTLSNFVSPSSMIMNDANNGYLASGAFLLKTTDGWVTWTYDVAPLGLQNLLLYPKIPGPIGNKKLLSTVSQSSFFTNSTISATLLEYGNAAAYTVSATETAINASCTNPTAGSITVNATGGIAPYSYSIDGSPYQSSNVFSGLTQGNKII